MRNPYRFDERGDGWLVLNISGGRTSGYMLHQILEAHGGELPERCVPIFTNTGKERDETLDFLREIETRWSIPLVWLEYCVRDQRPKHHYRIVNYETASRSGRPFEDLVLTRAMTPNVTQRISTSELKVDTIDRYMRRELKVKNFRNVLGIRHDEPRRWSRMIQKEDCAELPLVMARATVVDVNDFWAANDFDLAITSDQGNCDLCFLKGREKLIRLIREDPSRADWWSGIEKLVLIGHAERRLRKKEMGQFSKRYTYEDLKRWAAIDDLQMELLEGEPEESLPCFCGD